MDLVEIAQRPPDAAPPAPAAAKPAPQDKKEKKKKKKSHSTIYNRPPSDAPLARSQSMSPSVSREGVTNDLRVVLNVGGRRFETLSSTLRKYPHSLLGTMFDPRNAAMLKPDERGEFFFDRNPAVFESILDFYRNGEFFPPVSIPKRLLKLELDFWRIDIEDKATKVTLRSKDHLESLVAVVCEHLLASADDPPRDIILSRKNVLSNEEDTLTVSQFGWSFKRTRDSTARGVFGCKTVVDKALWAFTCAGKNQNVIVQRLRSQGITVQILPLPLPACTLKRLPVIVRCNYTQITGSRLLQRR